MSYKIILKVFFWFSISIAVLSLFVIEYTGDISYYPAANYYLLLAILFYLHIKSRPSA